MFQTSEPILYDLPATLHKWESLEVKRSGQSMRKHADMGRHPRGVCERVYGKAYKPTSSLRHLY